MSEKIQIESISQEELFKYIDNKFKELETKIKTKNHENKILNFRQVMNIFGFSRPTLTTLTQTKVLPCYKIGRQVFFKEKELYECLEKYKK